MRMDQKNNDEHEHIYAIGFIAVVVVIGILITNFYLVPKFFLDDAGIFGDMFGGANALFSGLAFVGVIIAILLQSKELELQRKELKATTKALEDQRIQMELQNETIRKQQFENTFFELMRLRNEIAQKIREDDNTVIEQDLLISLAVDKVLNSISSPYEIDPFQGKTGAQYQSFFFKQRKAYKKIVLSMLELIERNNFNESDQRFYAELLQAQLSNVELHFLAYIYLHNDQINSMKRLIKYGIFDNLSDGRLISGKHLDNLRQKLS